MGARAPVRPQLVARGLRIARKKQAVLSHMT
jgi:hypothetical protein